MRDFFVVLLTLFAVVQANHKYNLSNPDWLKFKDHHNKSYANDEVEQRRYHDFLINKDIVTEHNLNFSRGLVSYKMKLNKYSDMLRDEFVQSMNGFNRTLENSVYPWKKIIGATFIESANVELPDSVDWRRAGAVTGVKNQGGCGACWAFSTTGSLEGQHFRRDGKLISLSEQNLIDCSTKFGNNGCEGGLMDNAFAYIKANKGIDTEVSYPYHGLDEKCRYKPGNRGAVDVGFVDITKGNENKLKAAVATIGPISIAIDASHTSFQLYSKGIYHERNCSSTDLDHAVLLVGYGSDNGVDYWLVKNSWGPEWGEKGYVRMIRNKNNHCGIASAASYPLV